MGYHINFDEDYLPRTGMTCTATICKNVVIQCHGLFRMPDTNDWILGSMIKKEDYAVH